jgi:hypothetical protein
LGGQSSAAWPPRANAFGAANNTAKSIRMVVSFRIVADFRLDYPEFDFVYHSNTCPISKCNPSTTGFLSVVLYPACAIYWTSGCTVR